MKIPAELLDGLELAHEFAVDDIFDDKSRPAAEQEPLLPEDPGAVAQVEDQQVVTAWIERLKVTALQSGHQVVEEHRVLAHGVNADLVQGMLFEVDTVAAAEHVRMGPALKITIDQKSAVRTGRQAGGFKNRRRLDTDGHKNDIHLMLLTRVQSNTTGLDLLHPALLQDLDSP